MLKFPTPVYVVPNRSIFTSSSTNNWESGAVALEEETGTCWQLQDGASPADSSTATNIDAGTSGTPAPVRNFSRIPGCSKSEYKYQQDWHIDPVNGLDTAAGDSANPLQSVEELRQRIWQDQRTDMVVYVHGDTSDCYRGFYSAFAMRFEGVPTTTAKTSSATALFNASAGVNESSTLTDNAALAWAPYYGSFLRAGSKYAAVLKDLTTGKARLGQWLNTNGAIQDTAPAAGAYTILQLPTITIGPSGSSFDFSLLGSTEVNVSYKLCRWTHYATGSRSRWPQLATLCTIIIDSTSEMLSPQTLKGCCLFGADDSKSLVVYGGGDFSGTSFRSVGLYVLGGFLRADGVTTQGSGGIYVTNATIYLKDGPLASFDSTFYGIAVDALGTLDEALGIDSHGVFGKGANQFGFFLRRSGRARFGSSQPPTITGFQELLINSADDPMAKFVPGAANLPAAFSGITWAAITGIGSFVQNCRGGFVDYTA